MEQLHQFLPAAVAALIRHAPLSPGKVAFAWKASVGPAIDRVTSAELGNDGVLEVRVPDQHWRREVRRLAPVILDRLSAQLGPDAVQRLKVTSPAPDPRDRRRRTGSGRKPAPEAQLPAAAQAKRRRQVPGSKDTR